MTARGEIFDPEYSATIDRSLRGTGASHAWAARVKADYVVALLRRLRRDPSGMDVLDIGCGIGTYTHLLAPSVRSITGVDRSENTLKLERDRKQTGRVCGDATHLPFTGDAFDVALAITVLHHIPPPDWPAALGEFRRVLRPGGLLLIFEHNPRNPMTRRVVDNCPFDADAVLLSARESVDLARAAGFEKVSRRYILSVPGSGAAARRADGLLSWLGMGAQYFVIGEKPDAELAPPPSPAAP